MIFPIIHGLTGPPEQNFNQDQVDAGFASGAELIIDAGSVLCYPGTGQTLTNIHPPSGTDVWLGADGTAAGDDPTHNGAPGGLSSAEYFSFDGGDILRFKALRGWTGAGSAGGLHHNGAKWSTVIWAYIKASATIDGLFGTAGGSSANDGIELVVDASEKLAVNHFDGDGAAVDNVVTMTAAVNTDAWNMMGVALDEAGGVAASTLFLNNATETFDGAYLDPKAVAQTYVLDIGSRGNGAGALPNLSRIAGASFWLNRLLSAADFTTLWNKEKGRFGL